MSVVTQGFFGRRCLPRISLTVWVTAMLNVSIIVYITVFSELRSSSGVNFPPILACNASKTSGSISLSTLNLIFVGPSFVDFFRRSQRVIITKSWSLPMSAPEKHLVLAMFTLE